MSLRSRLWLVLGVLVLLPLFVVAAVVLIVVPTVQRHQLEQQLESQRTAAASALVERCSTAGMLARSLALDVAAVTPARAAANAVAGGASYAAVLDPRGGVLAQAGRSTAPTADLAAAPQCSEGQPSDQPSVLARVGINGETPGQAVVVLALDRAALSRLGSSIGSGASISLLNGRSVLASSESSAHARGLARDLPSPVSAGAVKVGDRIVAVAAARRGLPWTVMLDQAAPGQHLASATVAGIALLALLLTGGLLLIVAQSVTRPITALTEQAEQVAQGSMDSPVVAGAEPEMRRLSGAFNRVTDALRRNTAELEASRDELRDSLDRIGEALVSTHDVYGLLGVALETALIAAPAKAGVVLLTGADRSLELVGQEGLREAGLPLPSDLSMGEGVLGRVAETGVTVRGMLGSGPPELRTVAGEPDSGEVLAVALRSTGRPYGVIALYDPVGGGAFDENSEEAVRTLAGQVGIAVDNVLLHREAQRLSTTDALTGLWNFRYLSMSLAREVERSTRFGRPFAVLMLDLDFFKKVNDEHGHARGDMVLRELSARVLEQIREVDVFARYGGEEFVVVLPETTLEGATQLADRICTAVRREPFRNQGETDLNLTLSIGAAAFPEHGGSPATLMRAADQALYNAKRTGRDRWCVASD